MEVTPPDTHIGPAGSDPAGEIREAQGQRTKAQHRLPLPRTLLITLLGLISAPLLFTLGMVLHYQFVAKPGSLREAGAVMLRRMDTDITPGAILPKPSQNGNAAFYYVLALNSFNKRREPYLLRRNLSPIAEEPPISADDLHLLASSAKQESSDLYEVKNGEPRFVFYIVPGSKKWAFTPAEDPFEQRPYIASIRVMALAALKWGKHREEIGEPGDAQWAYENTAWLGIHLRDHPGSLNDIELGLEIEQVALHYLEAFYSTRGKHDKLVKVVEYASSVSRLLHAVRHKYAQLENVEVAMEVLASDSEPVWRIEAATALVHSRYFRKFSWPRSWLVDRGLRSASHDRSPIVATAVRRLVALKDEDFRSPDSGPTRPE